jgi:hypothetical protein
VTHLGGFGKEAAAPLSGAVASRRRVSDLCRSSAPVRELDVDDSVAAVQLTGLQDRAMDLPRRLAGTARQEAVVFLAGDAARVFGLPWRRGGLHSQRLRRK